MVTEWQNEVDRLNAVKNRIRTNLVAQGVTVPNDTTLDEMATLVLSVAGYTPVRGVDYWTEADQEAIVQQVITALGTPVFGRVDADNKIVLTGNVVAGVYEYWYEDENGKQSYMCTYEHDGKDTPTYTNLFNPATASINTRMSGSSKAPTTGNGYVMTALIPIPSITVTANSDDNFIAVPASMWTGSANMFFAKGSATTQGWCAANATAGTVVGNWVKIPLRDQYGGTFTCDGVTISLYVKGSAITAADIQNLEIYFNEIPE